MKLSLPQIPSILSDKSKKPILSKMNTVSNISNEKKIEEISNEAFNQLDKFLYLDEKFADNDKFSFKNPTLSKYDQF